MNWIVKPGSPSDIILPSCIADDPTACQSKDCAGAETFSCSQAFCNGLTCVAGAYTCNEAVCTGYWGECFQTDSTCPTYCPDYCSTHCPTLGWICTDDKMCNYYYPPQP